MSETLAKTHPTKEPAELYREKLEAFGLTMAPLEPAV